jgi:hypothetical protein
MKVQAIRKGRVWALSAALLAGLAYSMLTLTVSTKPVHASSCDCQEASQDAAEFCLFHYGETFHVQNFTCPTGSQLNEFSFDCVGPSGEWGPWFQYCTQ